MRDKWKNRKRPDLNDLLSIAKQNPQLHDCVIGHIIIETLLVQLIDTKLSSASAFDSFRLSFPAKTELCVAMGLVSNELAIFLKKLNTIRNSFAHRLGFQLSFNDIFSMVVDAAKAGVEFTDDVDKSIEFAKDAYTPQFLLQTVFDNTSHYLACILDENGGEYCFV